MYSDVHLHKKFFRAPRWNCKKCTITPCVSYGYYNHKVMISSLNQMKKSTNCGVELRGLRSVVLYIFQCRFILFQQLYISDNICGEHYTVLIQNPNHTFIVLIKSNLLNQVK